MFYYSFERLEIWQIARSLIKDIYKLSSKFPSSEIYGLSSQIKRASVSVASNIAEGSSRTSKSEQCRFLEIAFGSLLEVYTQLCIAHDLLFIGDDEFNAVNLVIKELSNKINALKNAYKSQINK